MFYTLLKFLWWGLLLALVGGWVGWSLRSLRARAESRAAAPTAGEEVDRLRRRLAELDGVVEERNRLLMRIADDRRGEPGGPAEPPIVPELDTEH